MGKSVSRIWGLALGVAAFAGLSLIAGSPASSAVEPVDVPEIVFDNGGRIVGMNADGTDRKVILGNRKHALQGFGRPGWHSPEVSPDGSSMIVQKNERLRGNPFPKYSIFITDRDGSGARGILGDDRSNSYFNTPAWMPDGTIAAVRQTEYKRRRTSAVVIFDSEGNLLRKVVDLPVQLTGTLHRDIDTPHFSAVALSPSPDGKRMLITLSDYNWDDRRRLEVADLETGEITKIDSRAYSGSWSPGGSKIIFSSNRGVEGEVCDEDSACAAPGNIIVADPDGSDRQQMTTGRGDEDHASFSPDGNFIIFDSNHNKPRELEATEIYSVKSDGSCMAWLTNGSPASVGPRWVPGARTPEIAGCLGNNRKALVEISPGEYSAGPFGTRLWAGPSINGLLLTSDDPFFGIEMFSYSDCAWYQPDRCRPGILIFQFGTCQVAGAWSVFFDFTRKYEAEFNRGVMTFRRIRHGRASAIVMAGGAFSMIGGLGSRTSGSDIDQTIAQLRPVGSPRSAKLPRFRLPREDLRLAARAKAMVRKTGSVRAAAKELGVSRSLVRLNLRLARGLPSLGKIQPVNCPKASRSASNELRSVGQRLLGSGVTP